MPVTSGKIQFADNGNTLEISLPIFGYKTIIDMPLEIVRLDNGKYELYDHGEDAETYDIRKCQCTFLLTATEQNSLNGFFNNAAANPTGRGIDVTIRMNTGSGFFPFGADKGDVGDFDVAARIIETPITGESPFNYFTCKVEFIHTGTYPVYSLPAEISEGSFTIGTITNNRFPPAWFKPKSEYANWATIELDSSSQWIDRGTGGDWYDTEFEMHSNESKCAKVIEYLTGAAGRSNIFQVSQGTNYYMFGRDITTAALNVKLIQKRIVITHSRYNLFTYPLNLSYVSVVA